MTATSAMNATAVLERSSNRALRLGVVALVSVLLVLGSFAFGRVSAGTSHPAPAIAPSAQTVAPAGGAAAINPWAIHGSIGIGADGVPYLVPDAVPSPTTAADLESCRPGRAC